MKCIDITRELLGSPVYPGDPAPRMEELRRIRLGDECNVSALYACLHNGTHLDAPRHFMPDGQTIDELPLTACIGECSVVEGEGLLLGAQAEEMLPKLKKRILFKGRVQISPSAAFVLSDAGLWVSKRSRYPRRNVRPRSIASCLGRACSFSRGWISRRRHRAPIFCSPPL